MPNRKPSDAASSEKPTALKRKRQASCRDEQERRERKRALDREAQRSLREKTKTRIADLERTLEMLQEKDGNSATANLLSEIDALRAENERLRQIIANVRSLVGGGVVLRDVVAANGEASEKDEGGSPVATNIGPSLPEPLALSVNHGAKAYPATDTSQLVSTEQAASAEQPCCTEQPIFFDQPLLTGAIDLDGMSVVADTHVLGFQEANENLDPNLALQLTTKNVQEQEEEEEPFVKVQREPACRAMLQEMFGPGYRSPSPTILYLENPTKILQPTPCTPICPIWMNLSEVLSTIFTYRSQAVNKTIMSRRPESQTKEAGLLYLGVKNGWDTIPDFEWQHYPALRLVRKADELAFHRFFKTERLAVLYKSLKLLTYYLNATKQDLENVPVWLRPSSSQPHTPQTHPFIIDFFTFPSLRSRFFSPNSLLSRSTALSFYYPSCLRFDWPFSFEDTFFHDPVTGNYLPNPLFEMYLGDLKHWKMEERFYENFPETRGGIEGDRMLYTHVEV